MPLVVSSLTGRCQVSQSRGLCFQCLLQAGQRALSSLGCLVEVCLLGPRCWSFGPLSVTPEVSPPALLGNDSASFPRSQRLVFSPWQLPCSVPSNDSFHSAFSSWLSQELFCILASDFSLFLSMAVHVFCFSLGILEGSSIRSCCSTLAVVQFQYNFTLKCKEPSLQLSKMKRWNSVSNQLCV